MSSNSSKYRFEHEMAPHVDPKWAATFTMELNIRQAAGEEIGAALAEVDSHCAESGESAQEAFGDPIEYASQLDLSSQPVKKQRQMGISSGRLYTGTDDARIHSASGFGALDLRLGLPRFQPISRFAVHPGQHGIPADRHSGRTAAEADESR